MRAALMERGKIWVDDIPEPIPQAGEVVVNTLACGICGSDLHAAQHTQSFVETSREAGGAFKLTTFDPVVLGHEFCAELVEYGPDTRRTLPLGTHVCSIPMLARPTMEAVGYSAQIPGGFAERMVLSESMLVQVPQGTPPASAALTEPMAVGLHAVNKARLRGNEAVLVIGCGPVGLAIITALRGKTSAAIIASDYSEARRKYALQQGAHIALNPAVDDPFRATEMKKSEDTVIFECVGVPGMLDQVFLGAKQNARIVVVGVCLQMDQARPLIAINKELNVQYVLGYTMDEFSESLTCISDGSFDIGGLVSRKVPLSGVADAFEQLRSPDSDAKVIVEPHRSD